MTLRVLIADDEELSRERLKRFLRTEPGTELVAECASGSEAAAAIREQRPDLAFLDIRMPEMDGFAVLKSLRGVQLPAIVFVTGYTQFAPRAFEIDAVDYLLKPFDRQRFQTTLKRVRRRLQQPSARVLAEAGAQIAQAGPMVPSRVTVKNGAGIVLVKTSEIDWVTASDNYIELHVGPKVHLMRMTITGFTQQFGRDHFARISRSVLVNLNAVEEILSRSHGDYWVVLHDGNRLAGSRNCRQSLGGLLRVRGGGRS